MDSSFCWLNSRLVTRFSLSLKYLVDVTFLTRAKDQLEQQIVSCFFYWVLLNRAPSSTQLHPPTPHSTQLHPPPPSSFQPPPSSIHLQTSSFQPLPSSLHHPQQYLNQIIARNWAISPNLGRKIKNCPFWLKIGTHDILEVLIPNPDLNFWNSNPKIHFWSNLGPKIQTCPFCQKIGTHSISRILILNADLDFWNFGPKIHIWAKLGLKI